MMRGKIVKRRIEAFEKRWGNSYLYLAYHAAFPMSLTPDLLYRIWANFKQDCNGNPLDIDWIAVADLLVSPLCKEVGYELYEMDSQVREELLKRLKTDSKFGKKRIEELSEFLLAYIQPHLHSEDLEVQELAQVQRWTALAYTKPHQVAVQIAHRLAEIKPTQKEDFIWMESLIQTLKSPLSPKCPNLLLYAQGMGSYGRGELEKATDLLMEVPSWGNNLRVAGVELQVPKDIQFSHRWQRRRLLKWGLYTLLGCGAITAGYGLYRKWRDNPPIELFKISVETVKVNSKGEEVERQIYPIKYFRESLGNQANETNETNETNEVYLDMVDIPGGTFIMGTEDSEIERLVNKFNFDWYRKESPQHKVTIKPFYMSKYPITQGQWKAIALLTKYKVKEDLDPEPSRFKDNPKSFSYPNTRGNLDLPYYGNNPTYLDRPVESVNWYQAKEFCDRLSQLTGRKYRLPTEAEWEYACRAVTINKLPLIGQELTIEEWNQKYHQPFYFGETITSDLANYDGTYIYADEPEGAYRRETTPVGMFPPNAFGLYDLHGNVWEWCEDNWHDNYNNAPNDGSAWTTKKLQQLCNLGCFMGQRTSTLPFRPPLRHQRARLRR